MRLRIKRARGTQAGDVDTGPASPAAADGRRGEAIGVSVLGMETTRKALGILMLILMADEATQAVEAKPERRLGAQLGVRQRRRRCDVCDVDVGRASNSDNNGLFISW